MGSLRERVGESLGALRDVFRNPPLRRVQLAFAGQVVGQYAYSIAIAVYAYRHGGATAVGIVAFVRLLAAATVAPFASVLADRHRRERVMLGSDLLRAALVAAAGAVVLAGGPALAVYALATVTTIAGTAFRPAEAALMPALARTPEELTAANVSSSTFDSLGSFLGPALGGLLLAVASPGWVFLAMAVCFLWSASFVARVRGPAPVRAGAHAHAPAETAAGFRAIAGEPRLRLLIGLYAAQAAVAGALAVLVVVTALDVLDMGNSGVGFLESASGIGSLAGAAVALALISRRRLAGDFGLGIVLWGAPLVLLGLWPNIAVALAALAVVGVGNTLVDISAMTLLQRFAPEEVAGRVFGVLESMLVGAIGLGSVAAPLLISLTSPRVALVVTGALLPVLAALRWRQLAEIDEAAVDVVPDERVEALRRIPIFAPLPLRTLELLASRLKEIVVSAGNTLFVRGESGGHFYVVVDGELEIVLDGETKVEREYVGEIALLRGVPRTATVRARTDARLWALRREDFLAAVTGHPGAREAANEIVGARLGYAPTA